MPLHSTPSPAGCSVSCLLLNYSYRQVHSVHVYPSSYTSVIREVVTKAKGYLCNQGPDSDWVDQFLLQMEQVWRNSLEEDGAINHTGPGVHEQKANTGSSSGSTSKPDLLLQPSHPFRPEDGLVPTEFQTLGTASAVTQAPSFTTGKRQASERDDEVSAAFG